MCDVPSIGIIIIIIIIITESLTVCTSGLHRISSVNPQAPKQILGHNLNLTMSGLFVTYR